MMMLVLGIILGCFIFRHISNETKEIANRQKITTEEEIEADLRYKKLSDGVIEKRKQQSLVAQEICDIISSGRRTNTQDNSSFKSTENIDDGCRYEDSDYSSINEDTLTDRILSRIKPKIDAIEVSARYSSDHPTNIWRKP